MFKNIFIDHMYTRDDNFKFFKSLKTKGFKVSEKVVEHPGKSFCRFVMLNNNQYLEFVYKKSKDNPFLKPGLSFGYKRDLEKFSKSLSKRVKFDCLFKHKNYEWKKDNVSRLPGWNFVRFKNIGIQTIYTWFTEYEPWEGEMDAHKKVVHPNTVYAFHGIELSLNEKGHEFFSGILAKKTSPTIKLSSGNEIFINNTSRPNRFSRIILKCKNLNKAKKLIRPDEIIDWHGYEALVIKNKWNGKRMWDLLIIQA